MGGLASFLAVYIIPMVSEAKGLPVRGYGVFVMFAIILATFLAGWQARRLWNIPFDIIFAVAIIAILFGIPGARIFYVIEYWDTIKDPSFGKTLFNIGNMVGGGLVVYGSIIGGFIAILCYLYWKKLPLLATLDLFAPALMLGIAVGRLGCLMNGCCFGAVCNEPWAITFPPGSPAYVQQLEKGEIFLAGFQLRNQLDNSEKKEDNSLFHLKDSTQTLWTEFKSPVVIEAVEPDSPAQQAGLKPEMHIKNLAFIPSTIDANDPKQYKTIAGFSVTSNADVFNFFFDALLNAPQRKVMMVCNELIKESNEIKIRYIVFQPKYAVAKPVHPTQLYSSFSALCLCVILLIIGRYSRRDGVTITSLFLLYPVTRFCLELFRTDEASFLGTGLSVSQCVSIVIFGFALISLCVLCCLPPRLAYLGRFPKTSPVETDKI